MNHQRSRLPTVAALTAMALLLLAGCQSSQAESTGTDRSGGTTPSSTQPVGVIAIGHSGLTGENSDPSSPRQPAPQNSWATGTSTAVDSVYERLLAVRPAEKGHVANTAVGGAKVTALEGQAQSAFASVRAPELVIVQTIDNDIRCDGTDGANVRAFGATLKSALTFIHVMSPQSQVLLVGQLGRPRVAYVAQLVATDPGAKSSLTGNGVCDFYDESGRLNRAAFTYLTGVVDSYEAEQTRVCAAVPNCHTDEGIRAKWLDKVENFTSDWNHLNTTGLAAEAQLTWPVVARVLRLNA
jgi:hypothetical protein